MIRRVPNYTSRIRVLDSEDLIGGPLYPLRELENTQCKRHPTLLASDPLTPAARILQTDHSSLRAMRFLQNESVSSLRSKFAVMTSDRER